jgi:hypothetical protein
MPDIFKSYQRKPTLVNAVRFTEENQEEIFSALGSRVLRGAEKGKTVLLVTTIQGDEAIVRHGDWIAQDYEPGCYYPISDEVFRKLYDE